MNLNEFLERVKAILDAAGIQYMVTGSVAAATHGASRSTQDVDMVIAPTREQLDLLLRSFPEDQYYLSSVAATEAFARATQFNVIDLATGWKVDFIFRKPREFSRAEFERRRPGAVFGVNMSVATPEDVIIAKLEWARSTGTSRQLEDAANLLRANDSRLDAAHLERWINHLGLSKEWAQAQELAKR